MKVLGVIIFIVILLFISILINFIKKKINNSLNNAFENVTANRRNKNIQQQGTQSLAGRYGDMNNQQSNKSNDPQN